MRSLVAVAIAVVAASMTSPTIAQVTYVDSAQTPGGNTTRLDGSNWAPQAVSNTDNLWRGAAPVTVMATQSPRPMPTVLKTLTCS